MGGVDGVEIAGGFVGKEEGGTAGEAAGNGHALHLAAAELVRKMPGAVGEADEIEHFLDTGGGFFSGIAAEKQGEFDILADCHCGEEVEKLEDDAERVAAVMGEFTLTGGVEGESIDAHFARSGGVETAENVEEGAFAATAGAGNGGEVAGGQIERDAIESAELAGARGIGSRDIAEFDHGAWECFRVVMSDQAEFRILGETEELLAVEKPAGVLVHPSKPGGPKTLWDGLRELLSYEIANSGQVSLINRLDRETSGVVLVAKTAGAARQAAIAMQEGKVRKRYLAIVTGHPAAGEFRIDAPIVRRGEVMETSIHLQRMVHPGGATAVTEFRVVEKFENRAGFFSLLEARPLTGRTHQIRVHAAYAGYPVVGDKIYGPSNECYLEFIRTGWTPELAERLLLPRHALHSAGLGLEWEGRRLEWTSPLPRDLRDFFETTGTP